jgi:hypothetical protein
VGASNKKIENLKNSGIPLGGKFRWRLFSNAAQIFLFNPDISSYLYPYTSANPGPTRKRKYLRDRQGYTGRKDGRISTPLP